MVETGKFIQRILKLVIGAASVLAFLVFLLMQIFVRPASPVPLCFAVAFAVLAAVFLISFVRDGSREKHAT